MDKRRRKLNTIETTLKEYMHEEKMEEKDLTALKTALTHLHNDMKTT